MAQREGGGGGRRKGDMGREPWLSARSILSFASVNINVLDRGQNSRL